MVKSGTGNAHGAEFQSDGEEITEKSLLGMSMQGQSCWGFRVVYQLFAVHSWELQLVLVDTPRGMLEYGGGIGSALALRMRWLGSRILQWALLPVARRAIEQYARARIPILSGEDGARRGLCVEAYS